VDKSGENTGFGVVFEGGGFEESGHNTVLLVKAAYYRADRQLLTGGGAKAG